MSTLLLLLSFLVTFLDEGYGLCGSSIRWSHNFNMEDTFGMWYGIGYAQHTPDYTSTPNRIGCVIIYISDATTEINDDWVNLSLTKRNFADGKWLSRQNYPFFGTALAGSWLDVRANRRAKRDMYDQRRVRVLWDKNGEIMEQVYLYAPEEPGLWTLDQLQPLERERHSLELDLRNPDDPPRHRQVIRILKVSPESLLINHCSEESDGGIISFILRRSPIWVDRWQWYDIQSEFYRFDLPNVYRHSTICATCMPRISVACLLINIVVIRLIKGLGFYW